MPALWSPSPALCMQLTLEILAGMMLWSSLVVDHWDWVWLQEQGKMDIVHYPKQYFDLSIGRKIPNVLLLWI